MIINDWKTLTIWLADSPSMDKRQFYEVTFLLLQKVDVDKVNYNKLRTLNYPIARINAVHTGHEASKADSNTAKGLESHLLLVRGARIILRANLWIEAGLINGSMKIV